MPVGISCVAPGCSSERRVEAGAQVEARGPGSGVVRQRVVPADARIEDAHLQARAAHRDLPAA